MADVVTLLASYPYPVVAATRIGSESLIENTQLDGLRGLYFILR